MPAVAGDTCSCCRSGVLRGIFHYVYCQACDRLVLPMLGRRK